METILLPKNGKKRGKWKQELKNTAAHKATGKTNLNEIIQLKQETREGNQEG